MTLLFIGIIFYFVVALTIILGAATPEDRKWLWVCLSWPYVIGKWCLGGMKEENTQTKMEEPL